MLPSCAAVQQLLAAEDKSFLLHVCAQGAPSLPVCMYTLSVSKKYPTYCMYFPFTNISSFCGEAFFYCIHGDFQRAPSFLCLSDCPYLEMLSPKHVQCLFFFFFYLMCPCLLCGSLCLLWLVLTLPPYQILLRLFFHNDPSSFLRLNIFTPRLTHYVSRTDGQDSWVISFYWFKE